MNPRCWVPDSAALPDHGPGPLAGLRVAVKDLFAITGRVASFGNARWRDTHDPAASTADVVQALLRAGARIAGQAKMDELAYSLIGNVSEGDPPVNTADPDCFCGGSSSGSASAVAAGLADLGLGTDTAGSIRVPAAATGRYGLRPTYGVISTTGVLPLAPSFDVVGLLATTAARLAAGYGVLAGPAPSPPVLRRALLPAELPGLADDTVTQHIRRSAAALSDVLDIVEIPATSLRQVVGSAPGELFARLQGREIWAAHGAWIQENAEYLTKDVRTRLRRCAALSQDAAAVQQADRELLARYQRGVSDLLGEDTVLILPVLPRHGPRIGWTDEELRSFRAGCFQLTALSSLTGRPQLVFGRRGPEPALSVVGPRGSDAALLALAQQSGAAPTAKQQGDQ